MSRLRFRSLLGPRGPARWPAASAPAQLPILSLACTLELGQAAPVTGAVLTRVLAERCPPGTVILDLGVATELADADGEALHGLLDQLAGRGIRLRLASTSAKMRAQLADAGLADRLGRGGIQQSVHAAVLAVYAALPGPGVVTPEIRAALAARAEPVGPACPALPADVTRASFRPATLKPVTPDQMIAQPGPLVPPEPA